MKCAMGKEISVYKTPAGYYIGVWDEDGPRCRISGYYNKKESAEKALECKTFFPDEGCVLCPGVWSCLPEEDEDDLDEMDVLFRYRVEWHDANGAGELESGIQYEGFCRQKALSEKHEAETHSCGASITVLVPGPKGWYSPSQKREDEEETRRWQEKEWARADAEAAEYEKNSYRLKTADGKIRNAGYNARLAVAMFLYEQQVGNDPEWIKYPGDCETKEFYSLNDGNGKFLVLDSARIALLFNNCSEAHERREDLSMCGQYFDVCFGGVTSDGLVAGPEPVDDCIWDYPEKLDEMYDEWESTWIDGPQL